jgi:hypothetical protein
MHDTAAEFLFLSEPDMIKAGVLDMAKCVRGIDEVFRLVGEGDYLLFTPRDFWTWLNEPFTGPPPGAGPAQLVLEVAEVGQQPGGPDPARWLNVSKNP